MLNWLVGAWILIVVGMEQCNLADAVISAATMREKMLYLDNIFRTSILVYGESFEYETIASRKKLTVFEKLMENAGKQGREEYEKMVREEVSIAAEEEEEVRVRKLTEPGFLKDWVAVTVVDWNDNWQLAMVDMEYERVMPRGGDPQQPLAEREFVRMRNKIREPDPKSSFIPKIFRGHHTEPDQKFSSPKKFIVAFAMVPPSFNQMFGEPDRGEFASHLFHFAHAKQKEIDQNAG